MNSNYPNNQYGYNQQPFNQPQNQGFNNGYNPNFNNPNQFNQNSFNNNPYAQNAYSQNPYAQQNQFNQNPYQNPYVQQNQFNQKPYSVPPQQNTAINYPQNQPVFNQGVFAQNINQNYYEYQQKLFRMFEQKKDIKRYSLIFALAMLFTLVPSAIVSIILDAFGLMDFYYANTTFSSSVGIFYSVLAIGLPFFVANRIIEKKSPQPQLSIYSAPKASAFKTIIIIFLSVFGCLAAMFSTGFITSFFEGFGFTFSSGEDPVINNAMDIVAMFVGTAVIPPLVEEFAMRHVVMQPLRKYGNSFAILASALAFGVFHGTPTQIPFAFLCGLFLGYAVIATESIWTGVIIHAIVNSLSCSYYTFLYFTDEDTADTLYYVVCLALLGVGLVSLIIYRILHKHEFKEIIGNKGLQDLSGKEKFSKFIFTPLMIIAIIIFLIQAITMISIDSGVQV